MNARKLLSRHCPRSLYLLLRSYYNQRKRSVSQFGQDFWVFGEVFNEKVGGYFIDVGAADGITFSNTYLMETRYKWQGVCIEANPALFADLKAVRNAVCMNACVDSHERYVTFALRGMVGGILDHNTDNTADRAVVRQAPTVAIKARTLLSILESAGSPRTIDYLSIDVEGAEDRVLSEFPFAEYRFNCMTIERPKMQLRKLLAHHGYILIKEMPEVDAFYIHESFCRQYMKNATAFWEKYRCS